MNSPAVADDLITAIAHTVLWACERHGADPAAARATAAEACVDLCRHWGGGKHWVPQTYRPGRNTSIIQAVRSGEPVAVIAVRLCVSVDTVRRVVRRQSAGLGSDDWML